MKLSPRSMPLAACVAALVHSGGAAALTFEFYFNAGATPQFQQAVRDAGALWSSRLTDNVTLAMQFNFFSTSSSFLGSAQVTRTSTSYGTLQSLLTADRSSAVDATVVANLPAAASVGRLINNTSDNPNGYGSATPYVDPAAALSGVSVSLANYRALNGPGAPLNTSCPTVPGFCDATISVNTRYAYDADRSDGIGAGQYDLFGVAAHEIGHALGYVSNVDVLDGNFAPTQSASPASQYRLAVLDLFRWSAQSAASGVADFTADARDKFFSIDGGRTLGSQFSTGTNFGDGQQAGHWKDDLGIGLLDPTYDTGEMGMLTDADLLAFDAIGWNLAAPVPEPSTTALLALGAAALALRRRAGYRTRIPGTAPGHGSST